MDGREVDFVVAERRQLLWPVERKWSDAPVDRGIRYLKERFPDAEAWPLSATGTKDFVSPAGISTCPAAEFLGTLT